MDHVTLVVQILISAVFVFVGFGKVSGNRTYRRAFIQWRLPYWFLMLTGFLEMIAGLLLLMGLLIHGLALYGLLLLFCICIGAIFTHVRVKDGIQEMLPIIVLFVFILFLFLFSL
ncbi:DoxX family protein [Lysinibacillus sp. 3P01SB]|uniref:DoxX family protein n=1 Tax=Lysinibacillus sp. 3P01SB TaxID=3132284 RepID=UPI0039A6E1D9